MSSSTLAPTVTTAGKAERLEVLSAERKTLKVFTGNVQSLKPMSDILRAIAKTANYDIIAINETWLDMESKHFIAEICIQGYRIFYVDMPTVPIFILMPHQAFLSEGSSTHAIINKPHTSV